MDAVKEAVSELSALDVILLGLSVYMIWKLVISKMIARKPPAEQAVAELQPMRRSDMTVEELRDFDGVQRPDGRICIACDGKIFDVTKGKRFYGKEGPYGIFAGRDASRGLATFNASAEALRDTYDDLTDLTPSEVDGMREWANQLQEKYPVVGRLLKPGDIPEVYSDEEGEKTESETASLTPSTASSHGSEGKKRD